MEEFRPFSLTHALSLLAIAATSVALAWHGRRNGGQSRWARWVGAAFVIEWLLFHTWKATPPELRAIETLPLQMCHWAAFGAGLYLACGLRALQPILYFWGIGLCTQALITPVLREGPNDPVFWHFWVSHGMIIVAVAFALIADRYRPSWRDYRIACVATFCYGIAVLPVNLALGANYGFLGRSRPDQPTLVDLLGPWPERIAVIVLIVAAIMALIALPWRQKSA